MSESKREVHYMGQNLYIAELGGINFQKIATNVEFDDIGTEVLGSLQNMTAVASGISAITDDSGSGGIVVEFFMSGNISTGTMKYKFVVPTQCSFFTCRADATTAPATTSILIDINKNGTTIFTTQGSRVTIAAAANAGTQAGTPEVTIFAAGDVISFDVDQIGTGTVGANTAVTLVLNPFSQYVV